MVVRAAVADCGSRLQSAKGDEMKLGKWMWRVAIIAAIVLLVTVPVLAQDYTCTQDRVIINVYINRDGSADIEYYMTFTCDVNSPGICLFYGLSRLRCVAQFCPLPVC